MEPLDPIFATLAEPIRLEIVEVLKHRPHCAGDLAKLFQMSPQAMSRHLRMLRRYGLVEERPDDNDARVRVYSLRPEPFAQMQEWLVEVAAFWDEQMGAFKAHAERKRR